MKRILECLLIFGIAVSAIAFSPREGQSKTYTIRVKPKDEELQWMPGVWVGIEYTKLDASPPTTHQASAEADNNGLAEFELNLGAYAGDLSIIVTSVAQFQYIVADDEGIAEGHDPEADIFPLVEPKVVVTYVGYISYDGARQPGVDVQVRAAKPGFTSVYSSDETSNIVTGIFGETFEIRFRTGTLYIDSVEGYGSWNPGSRPIAATWDQNLGYWTATISFGDVDCDT